MKKIIPYIMSVMLLGAVAAFAAQGGWVGNDLVFPADGTKQGTAANVDMIIRTVADAGFAKSGSLPDASVDYANRAGTASALDGWDGGRPASPNGDGDFYLNGLNEWSQITPPDLTPYVKTSDLPDASVSHAATASGATTFQFTPGLDGGGAYSEGKIYYDDDWKTLSLYGGAVGDIKLQIGQETVAYVYNGTASPITQGKVVYIAGAYGANGYPSIALADNTAEATSFALGVVTTASIAAGGYGFVTIRGHVHDLNTNTFNVGDSLYLGTAGTLTNVAPSAGAFDVRIGRVMIKDPTAGAVYVNVRPMSKLTDLSDVTISTPMLDQVLRYNGVEWVNGAPVTSSASAGIDFFNSTPVITSRTSPAGLSQDGVSGNGIQINSLSKTPVTSAEQTITGQGIGGSTVAYVAWLYDTALGRTSIDSGVWDFTTFAAVSSTSSTTTTNIRAVYQVVPCAGTLNISGTDANTRTAALSAPGFTGTYFVPSETNTTASWIQATSGTNKGIYQITAAATTSSATITVRTGYTNETGLSCNIWNKLFSSESPTITATGTNYAQVDQSSAQPAFTVATTDKLGQMGFVKIVGGSNRTLTVAYNGTARNTHFSTPLITLHNNLAGLQGGATNEMYHANAAEYSQLQNLHSAYDGGLPSNCTGTLAGNLVVSGASTLDAGVNVKYGPVVMPQRILLDGGSIALTDFVAIVNTTDGVKDMQLPDPATCTGQIFVAKRIGANTLTISVPLLANDGGTTISSTAAPLSLTTTGSTVWFQSDGSNYNIIASFPGL